MRCIMPTVMKDPIIDEVEADALMSDPYKILDLDLVRCTKKELQFATQYKLRMNFADKVHGLVAWFDTPFSNLENPVVLSTSPHQKKTHCFYARCPLTDSSKRMALHTHTAHLSTTSKPSK